MARTCQTLLFVVQNGHGRYGSKPWCNVVVFFFSIVNSTCAPYIPLFHCRKPGSKDSEVNHNPTNIYIHIHNNPCIHQKITDPNAHGFRFPMFFPCFFPFLEPIMFPSFSHDFYSFPEARCVARNDWVPSL